MLTKGSSPDKLDATSEWPIRNDCSVNELPEETKAILVVEKNTDKSGVIDIERFSKFSRLIRTTAGILNVKMSSPKRSLSSIGEHITVELME